MKESMKSTCEWSETRKEKSERVDDCLNQLMKRNAVQFLLTGDIPKRMTLNEIADYCGVDRMVIHTTEQRALQKLRSNFKKLDL